VRCIPSAIPESIEVDVSALEVNDVLHIYDIVLGEGVELLIPSDGTICSVAPPRLEEEPAEPVEGVLVEGEEPEGEGEGDEGGAEESEEG
jgi:large subunit ribosomal protein L25